MIIENQNANMQGGGDGGQRPPVITSERLLELTRILQKYKSGKASLEARVIASENWWKLRNASEEALQSSLMRQGFVSKSGWLHNVISSKHADAVEAYPEANVLPREAADRGEARMLSSIIPCILEQNHFDATYSDAMWAKMKQGTAIYKPVWDKNKLHGLGDIGIECVSVLNLFWEPGIKDIQKSRYIFQTELYDKDVLQEMYPDLLAGGIKGNTFISSRFLDDDKPDTENKATVIECYYHKYVNGKNTLQYIKYVGDVVLYATENETEGGVDPMTGKPIPSMAERGLYDHGLYPFVFDALFPVEGSPCGYGFVDLCQNPQLEIDVLKTCFVRSARVGAVPRYFSRKDGNVNVDAFLDLERTIVPVEGNVDEATLRRIETQSIDGSYMNLLEWDVNELKETSGNTDASQGIAPSGVTAASGIAALQEASGKGSRDSTKSSYRAFSQIVEILIELIRQFYNMPRKFRILGQYGTEEYVKYSNENLQARMQGADFGVEGGAYVPVFDVKVSAQKANVYTKITQNELALQLFQLGFCSPQMSDQALMCLDMMDFDGKDEIMQKISKNGTMFDKLAQYMELSLTLAKAAAPEYVMPIAMDMEATTGQAPNIAPAGGTASDGSSLPESDAVSGMRSDEHHLVEKARERTNAATQPV